ncbi:Centrosomal protein of 135 kDa [Tupaia chinensis]|uniref:Centrosomal protein of 135 kDa n=1 Tax=Tupaia chinensis TaxID=246437 RepID=L8Y4B4_TUPCH|nr:Centrosomal protein of 135 kDa [Tupaia chinensis]
MGMGRSDRVRPAKCTCSYRDLGDLVHTTESLRQSKLSAVKAEKESANFDFVLEPYKLENARLSRENNELYLELMKLREHSEQHIKGGKKRSIAFRRQRMQIDEPAPPSEVSSYPVPQPEDPYIADLLQVADNRIQELQQEVCQLQEKLAMMENGVRDYSKQIELREREIERLSVALDGGRSPDVLSLETRNKTNEKLIAHLNIQVDFLQQANKDLEKHIRELMETKETVTTEVVHLSNKNEKLCQELTEIDQLAQQLERHKEEVLETADKELGEAKEEIKRKLCEMRSLEETMAKLQLLESEKYELKSKVLLMKETIESLENKSKLQAQQLSHVAGDSSHQKTEVNSLRAVNEQLQRSLDDYQHRLSMKRSELESAQAQITALEENIDKLNLKITSQDEEAHIMKKTISVIDKEKDFLQETVDEKTEKIASLQDNLANKEKAIAQIKITVSEYESSMNKLKDTLTSRDREISSLRRQLDVAHKELDEVGRSREMSFKENRRLQDDLATMARENQEISLELEAAVQEKEEMKSRVHSYITEVSRWESLMAAKHISAHHAYESQISSMAKTMSRLEEEARRQEDEKAAILSDLSSLRELCIKLDSSKDIMTQQLNSKNLELERPSLSSCGFVKEQSGVEYMKQLLKIMNVDADSTSVSFSLNQ